jgi:Ni,Fe-hydrogenase III small subunit
MGKIFEHFSPSEKQTIRRSTSSWPKLQNILLFMGALTYGKLSLVRKELEMMPTP